LLNYNNREDAQQPAELKLNKEFNFLMNNSHYPLPITHYLLPDLLAIPEKSVIMVSRLCCGVGDLPICFFDL
jgi:hypothetical protein